MLRCAEFCFCGFSSGSFSRDDLSTCNGVMRSGNCTGVTGTMRNESHINLKAPSFLLLLLSRLTHQMEADWYLSRHLGSESIECMTGCERQMG